MLCLFLMTASRMRTCACDTASRLCVRAVLCSSAFSFGPAPSLHGLRSSQGRLVRSLPRYYGRPTSPSGSSSATASGLPDNVPATTDGDGDGDLPVPEQKASCACQGLRRRGASMCLAISTPAVLPSVGRKTSAPRICLTPLNTSPAPSPVNASRLPSRAARASLGAGAVRYAFTVTDFHRLPLAGLPAHP